MITRTSTTLEPVNWQRQLAEAISDPATLLTSLGLSTEAFPGHELAAKQFPLRVSQHYLRLIKHGDPTDPLLRQILPLGQENQVIEGYSNDPLDEKDAQRGHGILHKYKGRALLIVTGACGIHCRYCFRRHYPYSDDNALLHWEPMLQQLNEMPEIREVLLSGGDPLTLSDRRLSSLLDRLEAIPHLQRLRIHTRLPVAIPDRLTTELIERLASSRLHTSMVIHTNHPRELAEPLDQRLEQLRRAGITLLNQTVLLAGINDELETLCSLSEKLFSFGVLPYYLHILDPVAGSAHFEVPRGKIDQLAEQLRANLPGYLVPRIVKELAGQDSKTPLHLF